VRNIKQETTNITISTCFGITGITRITTRILDGVLKKDANTCAEKLSLFLTNILNADAKKNFALNAVMTKIMIQQVVKS